MSESTQIKFERTSKILKQGFGKVFRTKKVKQTAELNKTRLKYLLGAQEYMMKMHEIKKKNQKRR